MKRSRRKFLYLGAGVAMLPAAVRSAWAESYPAHPVRIVVGFAAGSTTDIGTGQPWRISLPARSRSGSRP